MVARLHGHRQSSSSSGSILRGPRSCVWVAAFGIAAVGAASARSQDPPAPELEALGSAEEEPRRGPVDSEELGAFIDGFMDAYLEETGAAGATVSVVRDGGLFFSKGYGYADVEAKTKVDAEKTLFRVGSVSKLFVWTAVMQLVEQGKLDLDEDVNAYLEDFQLPESYPKAVTLSHLMTHTPGFEDHVLGLFAHGEEALVPLVEILEAELPARVRPPGQVASYSNHGTGLAMHIVEVVSGTPWEDYVRRNVLHPLAMQRTTFTQPVPRRLRSDLSKGYEVVGGELEERGFEFVPLAPVGAASATATDMARFMLAHLQLGELDGARILSEETARRMQSPLFRHAEGMNAMAHGFMDLSTNGEYIIGHGGDTIWFHTALAFFPEHGVGIFASFNTAGANPSRLVDAFTNRYFPIGEPDAVEAPASWEGRVSRFVGDYRGNRFSHTDFTKLAALFGAAKVSDAGDGALLTSLTGKTRWIETDPLVFREEDGHATIVFREDDEGRISHFLLGDLAIIAFERTPGHESPGLHLVLLGASLLLFLATVLHLPVAGLVRRHYRVQLESARRLPATTRLTGWLASAIFLTFTIGLGLVMQDPNELIFGIGAGFKTLLVLPLVGLMVAVVGAYLAFRAWRDAQAGLLVRCLYSLVIVACFVFCWQLWVWNLLGFQY